MKRLGRKKKVEQNDDPSFDFKQFNAQSPLMGMPSTLEGFFINPQWANTILKQISGLPAKYDRETILSYLENPIYNEKPLRQLAQYLYINIQHFNRILNYFASIPDFRYCIYPVNLTNEKDVDTAAYKKSEKAVLEWLSKFNIKREFGKVMRTCMMDDATYWYVRESEDGIYLQRMPADYSLIVNNGENGYVYAFNMVYFLVPGVSLKNFAPEFTKYYESFLRGEKSVPFYWKELDTIDAPVFKWNEDFAAAVPPFAGLLVDAVEIANYKELIKNKTVLDNFKILFQKIPIRVDKDAKKNDYLIDKDSAKQYHNNIKNSTPPGSTVITTPMDISAVSFAGDVQTRDAIVGMGEKNFFNSAGVSTQLFNPEKNGNIGVKSGIKVDESYVANMMQQFKRFIDAHLARVSGKFKFEIDFMDSSIFNIDDQVERELKNAQSGLPVTRLAGAAGYTPNQFHQTVMMENGKKIKDKLKPLQLSSTMSGKDEAGRKSKKVEDLDDSGIKTLDAGSNEGRE